MSSGEGIDPPSLAALAARAQLGDRKALEDLLRDLEPPLHEHIRSIVLDDDAAADILQDTLLIICRRLGSVRETRWVRAWAYRVATREAVRLAGKMRRALHEPIDEDAIVGSPAEPIFDEDLLAALPGKLAALPAGAQTVVRLHYLQALTQEEVAEALGIPLGTVKSRLAYGLRCLRESWKAEHKKQDAP